MANKYDPFIKKHLGIDFQEVPFDDLSISTATMDVRMHEHTELRYETLFRKLPVVPKESYSDAFKWPAGTIFAAKFEDQVRGSPPAGGSSVAFKNSTMIWMWLEEKWVNVKISSNNLHITGCKKVEHAAETARHLQLHIQHLVGVSSSSPIEPTEFYSKWPYGRRIDVCMINFNFKLGVALDLPKFDAFIAENFGQAVFSSYDQNIHGTSMPLKCPVLSVTYTVNDNGQISMCTKEADVEKSYANVCNGYNVFYVIAHAFNDSLR